MKMKFLAVSMLLLVPFAFGFGLSGYEADGLINPTPPEVIDVDAFNAIERKVALEVSKGPIERD
jgi:hypothetical protein